MIDLMLISVLIPLFSVFISFVVLPAIFILYKKHKLNKIGKDRAGQRSIKEILLEINFHNSELDKCKAELSYLMKNSEEISEDEDFEEELTPVVFTFNSKEIACKHMGVDIPKYIKSDKNVWYEYDDIALFDKDKRLIINDPSKKYVIISNIISKTMYIFRELSLPPNLNEEID